MLKEKLQKDLLEAMKSKDKDTLNTLRSVKGAIQLEVINNKKEDNDDLVLDVITKQIKMRNDSINEFAKANREDLIEQNKKEIALLSTYMRAQLSELEINKIIDDAFNTVNPTSSKDMGLIMKEVSPKLKGKADMGKVNNIIKDRLASL